MHLGRHQFPVAPLLLATTLIAFTVTLHEWSQIIRASLHSNSTGAGILAFFAAGYLLWQRRAISHRTETGSWEPVLLAGVASAGYYLGATLGIQVLAQVCAITLVFGAACSALSRESFRALLPVCIALYFAVPLPGSLNTLISDNLRLIDSRIVELIGHAMGLPLTRYGSVIVTNEVPVDVGQDCDGLRLLWPMLLLTFTACASARVPRITQGFLVLMAIPVALTLNLVRLTVTTLLHGYWPADQVAVVHDLMGWMLLILAGFGPFIAVKKLSDPGSRPLLQAEERKPARQASVTTIKPISVMVISVTLAVITGPVAYDEHPTAKGVTPISKVRSLPYKIDQWVGEDRPVPDREAEILKADALVQREYHQIDGEETILMLVAYHEDGSVALGHNAPKCYRVRGWEVFATRDRQWLLGKEQVKGASYILHRGKTRMTVAEIFVSPQEASASARFPRQNVTSGPMIRIQFLIRGEPPEDGFYDRQLERFLEPLSQAWASKEMPETEPTGDI